MNASRIGRRFAGHCGIGRVCGSDEKRGRARRRWRSDGGAEMVGQRKLVQVGVGSLEFRRCTSSGSVGRREVAQVIGRRVVWRAAMEARRAGRDANPNPNPNRAGAWLEPRPWL